MNYYDYSSVDTRKEEGLVCAILCAFPDKYVHNLPYNVQEADFTQEACRNIYRTVHLLHDQGKECDALYVYSYIRSGAHNGDIPERPILFQKAREELLNYAARTVRIAAIQRRLRENDYPDEASRMAEQQEHDGIVNALEAMHRKFMAEEQERQHQLQLMNARKQLKTQAGAGQPEEHPLLPTLKKMVQLYLMGKHSDPFWTYAEVLDFFRRDLGIPLVNSARELPAFLPESFLTYLAEQEGIWLQLRQKSHRGRGIRIQPILRKRTRQEIENATEFVPQQLIPLAVSVTGDSPFSL